MELAITERQAAAGAGAETLPQVQDAIDRLDEMLNQPIVPTQEDRSKMRMRMAIGLPARPAAG